MRRGYFAHVLGAVLLTVAMATSAPAEDHLQVAFNFDFSFDFGAGVYNAPEVVVPSYLLVAGTTDNLTTPTGDRLTSPQ